MSEEHLMFEEIEVEVSGFFTTHHWFNMESGMWGELVFPAFAGYGTIQTPDGRELVMKKTHWLGSAHEFVDGDRVRGTADKASRANQGFVIEFDGEEYFLLPEGLFKQGWFLQDESGNRLIEIQPRGAFRQGAYLTILGIVKAYLAAFAYYLVHVRQQEAAAVVAATSS